MRCKVCGAQSGKYPLCRLCNYKKEQGEIIKCNICGQWHYKYSGCPQPSGLSGNEFLYEPHKTLISKSEQQFYSIIIKSIPQNYYVFPQINLATFISRTDNARYHNELFRNIDFLITDSQYTPKIAIEINDQSHLNYDRQERDEKVQNILEEAGIPLLKLWTSYGANFEYIKRRIDELLNTPIVRKHHFSQQAEGISVSAENHSQDYCEPPRHSDEVSSYRHSQKSKKQGCYIATCVYGSYDCPQVWTLRRYRDKVLSNTWHGRAFIKIYYLVSPLAVKLFGNFNAFHTLFLKILNKIVSHLNESGYANSPYKDRPY